MRRFLWPMVASVAAAGLLFLAVVPARTWLAQRRSIATAEESIGVLKEHNRQLADRARLLETDAEIERLAREQHNLVRPGEEAYAILPPPDVAPPPPPSRSEDDDPWWVRTWERLTSLL